MVVCQAFSLRAAHTCCNVRSPYVTSLLYVNCSDKADVTARRLELMKDWIRSTWCRSMHNQAMWPMHGKYICPRCLLEYPVPWETPSLTPDYADVTLRPDRKSTRLNSSHLV